MAKPANWNGQLRINSVYAAIFNMIISQQVFSDDIAGTYGDLVDMMRVDGSLYGDTKLFYATRILSSRPWGGDLEAANLLNVYRAESPDVQAITIDTYRQICLSTDAYLTKQAWQSEGAFAEFNSVILGQIRNTKRVYDSTMFNSYVGTTKTAEGRQTIEITMPVEADNTEATNRLRAQTIANVLANLFVDLKDVTRDFNDYGNIRSYRPEDLIVVWNSSFVNEITKFDLPTMFHNEGLIEKFGEHILPSRFFGNVVGTEGTATASGANITIRSLVEGDFEGTDGTFHIFPGELIPAGATYNQAEAYEEDPTVICKVMHKRSIPFMSAFTVSSSFYNPKALLETNYLTWGYNKPQYLHNYPFITLIAKAGE